MSTHGHITTVFRTEYSKLIAVLCKTYGLNQIEIAEDIVGETFLLVTETWGLKGVPQSPTGWLYTVAKNKTKDFLKRNKLFQDKIVPSLQNNATLHQKPIDFSIQNIQDSQLKMLFAICHPSLSNESQITLALRILCGFSIDQIASAFLTKKGNINKRLYRAKEALRKNNIQIEFPIKENLPSRLDTVLTTLYLVFNEGYYSSSDHQILNKDFCLEALRLAVLLTQQPTTHKPKADALIALMCFHASRFEARFQNGAVLLYDVQDRSLWDRKLIERGEYYLNASSRDSDISKYHLEAAIAFWHTQEENTEKWDHILQLYNYSLQLEYSPVTALNRTYALSKVQSVAAALIEAKKIHLEDSHLYHMLLAKFHQETDKTAALKHLHIALKQVTNKYEARFIKSSIDTLVHNLRI